MKLGLAFILMGAWCILPTVTQSSTDMQCATDHSTPTYNLITTRGNDKLKKKFEKKQLKKHLKANEQLGITVQKLLAKPGLSAATITDLNDALALLKKAADSKDVRILMLTQELVSDTFIRAL